MSLCVIFGGAGFVGTHVAQHFLQSKRFTRIHIADIRESPLSETEGITCSITDVRNAIDIDLNEPVSWIFNLAAIHREPGHAASEYFETNIKGAQNVCEFASKVNCQNIFFTSSIAVYGPVLVPTPESKLPMPTTPYGSSKLPAELIHQLWLAADAGRKLIISRPGVIYGPGDPGNIMRMIKAIRKGYFAFPGSKNIHKSYAYIYGFIESIEFAMSRPEPLLVYNYVETPTETIDAVTAVVKKIFNSKAPTIALPTPILLPVAKLLQAVVKDNNPIHPVRVTKAATPTHIVPQKLLDLGFEFKFDFEGSIRHWLKVAPQDFN